MEWAWLPEWNVQSFNLNLFLLGLILGSVMVYGYVFIRESLEKREGTMSKRERERLRNRQFADVLTSALEEEIAADRMSKEDAIYWYTRIGNVFSIKDLLPKNRQTVKASIWNRLNSDYYAKPMPLPDATAEATQAEAPKPKPLKVLTGMTVKK